MDVVLFTAIVVKGTAREERKSKKKYIITDVVERFLGWEDFSVKELHERLSQADPAQR